jgi:hypothetical protein
MTHSGLVEESTATPEPALAAAPRAAGPALATASQRRQRARIRDHAVMGAVVFLALQVAVGFPASLGSLRLIVTVLASAACGAPAGWVVSRHELGPLGGALITSGLFMLAVLIDQMATLLDGGSVATGVTFLAGSLLVGALPGLLIGAHVRSGHRGRLTA